VRAGRGYLRAQATIQLAARARGRGWLLCYGRFAWRSIRAPPAQVGSAARPPLLLRLPQVFLGEEATIMAERALSSVTEEIQKVGARTRR
jgi:hypothetical protein